MIVRRGVLIPALCLLLLLLSAPARAEREILITPCAGFLFGGSFQDSDTGNHWDIGDSAGVGFILNLLDTPRAYYELVYNFQSTELEAEETPGGDSQLDLDIHYLHIGGMYEFNEERVRPFIAAGFGLTALVPDGQDSSTNFSLSFGGGVKIPLSDRAALRLEGRGYLTIISDSGGVFCVSSGAGSSCDIGVEGDTLGQFEVLAGVSFKL